MFPRFRKAYACLSTAVFDAEGVRDFLTVSAVDHEAFVSRRDLP
jgi:hypothetical protein